MSSARRGSSISNDRRNFLKAASLASAGLMSLNARVHAAGDGFTTYLVGKDVSRRVVTDDDHQRKQVFDRRLQASVHRIENTRWPARIGGREFMTVGQRKLARFTLLQDLCHDRDLDDAERLVHGVRVKRDLVAGLEVLHVYTHVTLEALANGRELSL